MYIIILALIAFRLEAQVDSLKTETLPEVTLQASRIVATKLSIPISVTTIDVIDIKDMSQQLSLNDYINVVPGLFALNANNFSQDLRVSIRGFGARSSFGIRGVKIMVDGIPETTPDGQGQIDNLNLGAIEKMEIISGPSSTLYGNASGGVINILTKSNIESNYLKLASTFGSYDLKQYQIQGGVKFNNTGILLQGTNTYTDGYREQSGFESTNVNLRVKQGFSKRSELNILINYSDSPFAGDAGGLTLEEVNEDRRQARSRNVDFRTAETVSQFKLGANYSYTGIKSDFTSYGFFSNRDFYGLLPFEFGGIVKLDRVYYGIGSSYSIKSKYQRHENTFQLGYDFGKQEDDRSRFRNLAGDQGDKTLDQTESFTSFGIYALNHWRNGKLFIRSGIRYDHNKIEVEDLFLSNGDQSGDIVLETFNPSIGFSYEFSKTNYVYTNFSTSFETPVLSELSANPTDEGGFNKTLDPQKARNFEIGYKMNSKKFSTEIALFYINTKDDIVPYELEQFPDRTFYKNAGETIRKGIEFNYEMLLNKKLDMNLGYTFSNFKYEDYTTPNGDYKGNYLPGIPKHMGSLIINYRDSDGFQLRLTNRYVGALFTNDQNLVEDDGYLVANLNIGHSFSLGALELKPFLGVNNLFDTKYNDNVRINAFGGRYYEPAPELHVYGGIRLLL